MLRAIRGRVTPLRAAVAGVLAAAAVLVVLAPLSAGASPRRRAPRVRHVSLLYVLNARAGTLRPITGQARLFTFTLQHLESKAIWFSDRPARTSGAFASGAFAREWSGFGFASAPPNAALVYRSDLEGDGTTVILELTRPRYRPRSDSLSFTARWLDPTRVSEPNLTAMAKTADPAPDRAFADPSLFIDDTTAPVISGCILQPNTSCPKAQLQNSHLQSLDLAGGNLSYADVNFSQWDTMILQQTYDAYMQGQITLTNVVARDADFTNAILSNLRGTRRGAASSSSITNSDFTGANFTDANLAGINLTSDNFTSADFTGASLLFATLGGDNLTDANLTRANLTVANLAGTDFIGFGPGPANLTGANLTGANLTGANLFHSNLASADLTGANLTDARSAGANLTSAGLSSATLVQADLAGADLSHASLIGANLKRAILTDANLTGANLTRAYLSGADLTGADLCGATMPDGSSGPCPQGR